MAIHAATGPDGSRQLKRKYSFAGLFDSPRRGKTIDGTTTTTTSGDATARKASTKAISKAVEGFFNEFSPEHADDNAIFKGLDGKWCTYAAV
jgi:hypothetical protein